MPALSSLTRPDPVRFTVGMGAETVAIVFDSALMTGRWERDVARAVDAGDNDQVVSLLFGVLTSWDVVDDAGQPIPISEDVLMGLPAKAIVSLFEGMQKAARPTSEEGKALSAPTATPSSTFTESTTEPSRNGMDTSPSPAHST